MVKFVLSILLVAIFFRIMDVGKSQVLTSDMIIFFDLQTLLISIRLILSLEYLHYN